jgi:ribosomal-protein-alanine N-acetyltransferase
MLTFQLLKDKHLSRCLEIITSVFPTPWKELETIFHSPATLSWGAFKEDSLVGFSIVSHVLDECELLMCAVDLHHQRKGIAQALLKTMIEQLKQQHIKTIFLEVDITNTAAQNLYQSLGFKRSGIRKNYYLQPNGSYHDAITMHLTINN